ncbi:MAG: sulfatase-like hydrolase/transferase, partial [Planctomycetota bacterium]
MAEPQPNLLILYTDQQSRWTIGAYGSPEGARIGTPNIDRLAAEGVRFDNFFTNAAVCTPSRGCFFTGHYPHRHGAYHNNIPINPDEVTLGRTLADAGWQTGYLGKWHLDTPGAVGRPGWIPPDRAMGFNDCRFMFNSSHAKGVTERADGPPELHPDPERGRYMTDWLADKAIEFISGRRDRPFAFVVGIPDPHEPYRVREPYASLFR